MHSLSRSLCLLTVVAMIGDTSGRMPFSTISTNFRAQTNNDVDTSKSVRSLILELRGGAKRRKSNSRTASLSNRSSSKTATGKKKVGSKAAEEKSAVGDLLQKYKEILPLTRIYITMVALCTLSGAAIGEEMAQGILALDPMRVIYGVELWRPFTAASFLGAPSLKWIMSGYYLYEYGSKLERAYGTAQYLVFLLSQAFILSAFSAIFGMPFFADSMITCMLYVLSRSLPHEKVNWLVIKVPYWALPYGLMLADILQAGNAAAAMPHVLGILAGHFYHFHRFVWPKIGGDDWLTAPDFLLDRLDPQAKKAATKDTLSKALKSRKRGKGKKLGGK
jgi:derlin-1